MTDDRNERDNHGALTDWALACDALADNGCDCGEDEPGTCLSCLCESAMKTERARAERAEAEVARLAARIKDLEAGVATSLPAPPVAFAGAYVRCSCCGRYLMDPRPHGFYSLVCECGHSDGWSGSFVPPGPDATWSKA